MLNKFGIFLTLLGILILVAVVVKPASANSDDVLLMHILKFITKIDGRIVELDQNLTDRIDSLEVRNEELATRNEELLKEIDELLQAQPTPTPVTVAQESTPVLVPTPTLEPEPVQVSANFGQACKNGELRNYKSESTFGIPFGEGTIVAPLGQAPDDPIGLMRDNAHNFWSDGIFKGFGFGLSPYKGTRTSRTYNGEVCLFVETGYTARVVQNPEVMRTHQLRCASKPYSPHCANRDPLELEPGEHVGVYYSGFHLLPITQKNSAYTLMVTGLEFDDSPVLQLIRYKPCTPAWEC